LHASQDSIPLFKPIVEEWEVYCVIADREYSRTSHYYNKYTYKRNREVWEVVDKSLPLILSGNETWYVRILVHKIRGKHIDVRRFEYKTDGIKEWWEPTDEGICLPIQGDWPKVIDTMFKFMRKWKEK
jgi:hypothetical protein